MANNTIRYPNDVTTLGSYMILARNKFKGYTTDKLRNPDDFGYTTETAQYIALPMPNALSDSTGLNWQSEDDQSFIGQGVEMAKAKLRKVGREVAMRASYIAEKHSFQQFGGVAPKSWSFYWEFLPQNKQEANSIVNIIDILTEASLPYFGATGEELNIPDVMMMKFKGSSKFSMLGFLPCVITSINVDYSPDGTFFTYKDGVVPSLTMSLTLSEITSRNRSSHRRVRNRAK